MQIPGPIGNLTQPPNKKGAPAETGAPAGNDPNYGANWPLVCVVMK